LWQGFCCVRFPMRLLFWISALSHFVDAIHNAIMYLCFAGVAFLKIALSRLLQNLAKM